MPTSQNGWQVLSSSSGLDNSEVAPGVKLLPGVRSGDVATVLHYVAAQIHKRVEPLRPGWCWGYAYRAIRGQTSGFSNHASASAMDLNAPRHGRQSGSRYLGFNADQVAEIHKILGEAGRVVRWGGDYNSAPYDPMHFEVDANAADVHAAALRLASRVGYLGGGDSGPDVLVVQGQLNSLGAKLTADGDYGPGTEAAVRAFQQAHGLDADGMVGPATRAAITAALKIPAKPTGGLTVDQYTELKARIAALEELSRKRNEVEGDRYKLQDKQYEDLCRQIAELRALLPPAA